MTKHLLIYKVSCEHTSDSSAFLNATCLLEMCTQLWTAIFIFQSRLTVTVTVRAYTRDYDVTSHKTVIFIIIAVRTSYLTRLIRVHVLLWNLYVLLNTFYSTTNKIPKALFLTWGHIIVQWLRHYFTSRKVAGSRLDNVSMLRPWGLLSL
jgi:hypothetical protein